MSDKTGIQWTDATWNPVVGCEKVSQGCKNCYAKQLHDKRHKAFLAGRKVAAQYAHPFETVQLKPERLRKPLSWQKPKRVFVNSVSDVFHEDVPDEYIDRMFAVMAFARQHTFQILTKRPERMRDYVQEWAVLTDDMADRWDVARKWLRGEIKGRSRRLVEQKREYIGVIMADTTPAVVPNVWLGVSVENQAAADERIPLLLQTPAAVRFISAEPLLGPVDLTGYLDGTWWDETDTPNDARLGWVIAGGESGTKARSCEVQWIRAIVEQCAEAKVPCFVKQMGRWITGDHTGFVVDRWLLDNGCVFVPPVLGARANVRPPKAIAFGNCNTHGGAPAEWPVDLRLREFPQVSA